MRNRRVGPAAIMMIVLVVAVCLVAFGMHKDKERALQEQARRGASALQQAEVDHSIAIGIEVASRVRLASVVGFSTEHFRKEFGQLDHCDPKLHLKAPPDATHVYLHEKSHRTFYLRFQEGVLKGVTSSHSPPDIKPHLRTIDERMEEIR